MTPSWPLKTVDFFREVYVEKRQSKYLQLKFNPTIPVSEYCIDFSSLAPFLLPGTTVRLRCGQSTLELRNCDEVWNCASGERDSIDLSKILPKEVPVHKPQQRSVYISPSSESVPAIAKRRRENVHSEYGSWDSGEISQQAISGPSASDISARPNKKRRVAAESAARKASGTNSNMTAGGTGNVKQLSSFGTPINRGHPIGNNLAGNSSQARNDSKIPETAPRRFIGSSIRKGKGRESDMHTSSGHMPTPTPYPYSAPTSSSHKPSFNRTSTQSPFAIQTHITNRPQYPVNTPLGIQPSGVIPNRHLRPHLPMYGAPHGSQEIPKARSQDTGTGSDISGPQPTPAATTIELSGSRNSALGHSTRIGGSPNAPYRNVRAVSSTPSQGSPWQALRRHNPPLPSASYGAQAVPTSRASNAEGQPRSSGVDPWSDANRWQSLH